MVTVWNMNLLKSLSWVWVSLALCLGPKFPGSSQSQICSRLTNSPVQFKAFTVSWKGSGSLSLELWSTDWIGVVLFFQKSMILGGVKVSVCFGDVSTIQPVTWAVSGKHPWEGTHLSDVTRILSSLDELKRSSFSLKYSSMHCSSKSCTFLSSSSVMKSSVRVGGWGREENCETEQGPQQHLVCGLMTVLKKSRLGKVT